MPGFLAKYNPTVPRFIGSPIDYLIFRNMSKGEESEDPVEIVLLDVKPGKSGLNDAQKKIEAAVAAKRVNFDVLRIAERTASGASHEEPSAQQLRLSVLPVKGISDSDTTR